MGLGGAHRTKEHKPESELEFWVQFDSGFSLQIELELWATGVAQLG